MAKRSIQAKNATEAKTIPAFWILVLLLGLPYFAWSQQTEPEEDDFDNWDGAPVLIHLGGNLGRISGSEYPSRFDYLASGSGGLWLKYKLFQEFPFYFGMEYFSKGYNIDFKKSGLTNSGKRFEQESNGKARMFYLSFPIVFEIKLSEKMKSLRALAGLSMDVRMFSYEKFRYSYRIPTDSIVIEDSYQKYRNDAKDLLDGMFTTGLSWKPHRRFEIWLTAQYKLFGLSLGKENFFTRTEQHHAFNLRLFYRIARVDDIPFL